MFVIIGGIVVLVSVVGGYLIEKGNFGMLIQPVEMLIIFGAGLGAFLVANPANVIFGTIQKLPKIFTGGGGGKKHFLSTLKMLYELFSKIRKDGPLSIEGDVESPTKSEFFKKFHLDHETLYFVCDNLRMMVSANIPPHELEALMDIEIETHHELALEPSHAVNRVADAMPGLGIVAAVLGVVLTMGKIDQSPMIIGHSIAIALLGTFMGILSSYGFLGPMSTNLEHLAREETVMLQVIKTSMIAFARGMAPLMAVESGRRAIPGDSKPTFSEMEAAVKGK
jgi:chemotaxis protein MotA